MNLLYSKAAAGDEKALSAAARLQEQLELHDFYQIDTRIEQAAAGLGLLSIGLERQVEEISGGQRARVILAKLLLEQPSVLLLDEPTNFLDKEHVSWLADYLSGLPNAFMAVSHDHDFLERSVNRICDIHNGRLTKYYGSYSEFLKKKTFLQEEDVRQSKMARGRQKQLKRIERMEDPDITERCPQFNFSQLPLTNTDHLFVRHLSVGYQYRSVMG